MLQGMCWMRSGVRNPFSVGAGFDVLLTDRQAKSWNKQVLNAVKIIQLVRLDKACKIMEPNH